MDINTRVIKEPRGMIRIIQFFFAIFAFSTTTGFSTYTSLQTACFGDKTSNTVLEYPVEYPFNFEGVTVKAPFNCTKNVPVISQKFPMDFSSSAQFFVATGILCFLYTLGALVFYLFMYRNYETNPLIPVVDLAVSGVLCIFWVAGSCAFAATASDVKYYTHPDYLKTKIHICRDTNAACDGAFIGKWSSLNISLIFGFANIFLWAGSMWFVYKETSWHKQRMMAAGLMPPGGAPGMPGMPGMTGMAGAMPGQVPVAGMDQQYAGYAQPIGQDPMAQQYAAQPQQYAGGY